MRHRERAWSAGVALTVAAGLALSGCHVSIYGPRDYSDSEDPGTVIQDETLLAVTQPAGDESFTAGESVRIEWTGSVGAPLVTIELHRHGQHHLTIAAATENDGEHLWGIPADFDAVTEDPDDYQVVVRAEYPDYDPGELFVEARSETFTILPRPGGGLTDVTVSQRLVVITVTDNGSQVDGDTVDIVLNGSTVAAAHVLSGPPGTEIGLTLSQGANVLEIVALNEGSVTPNTAELQISNVVEGAAVQEWRLATGERGTLTITAP